MEEKILIKGKKSFPTAYIVLNMFLIVILFLAKNNFAKNLESRFFFSVLIVFAFITFLVFLFLSLMVNITITNKKIFGFTSKYTKVSVPIENIKSVSLINPYSISLKTSTGEFIYIFNGFKNAPELVKTMEKMMPNNNEQSEKDLDLLKKYKDLLDSGVITQLEFDTKKKEILKL